MRIKLKHFFDAVEGEFKEAKKNFDYANKSAQEVAASAALSPSQSGDRFHSQGAADMARQTFDNVRNLKSEIEVALEKGITSVEPPCFLNLAGEELYLVNYPVLMSGFKIISSKSPLGIGLIGKKAGDKVNGKEIVEIG